MKYLMLACTVVNAFIFFITGSLLPLFFSAWCFGTFISLMHKESNKDV